MSDEAITPCPHCGDRFHSAMWSVCRECREAAGDDQKCGYCGDVILDIENAVRARCMDAPNPFCDMTCAKYWESIDE